MSLSGSERIRQAEFLEGAGQWDRPAPLPLGPSLGDRVRERTAVVVQEGSISAPAWARSSPA
jgi:hypothetical protein